MAPLLSVFPIPRNYTLAYNRNPSASTGGRAGMILEAQGQRGDLVSKQGGSDGGGEDREPRLSSELLTHSVNACACSHMRTQKKDGSLGWENLLM